MFAVALSSLRLYISLFMVPSLNFRNDHSKRLSGVGFDGRGLRTPPAPAPPRSAPWGGQHGKIGIGADCGAPAARGRPFACAERAVDLRSRAATRREGNFFVVFSSLSRQFHVPNLCRILVFTLSSPSISGGLRDKPSSTSATTSTSIPATPTHILLSLSPPP